MPDDHEETNTEAKLNSYIYGYFYNKGKWDMARALKDSGMDFDPPLLNDNANGANDSVQTDSKDGIDLKRPDDLPDVQNLGDRQGGSFLSSWFALFWDIYFAQRKNSRASANANQYVTQTQVSDPHLSLLRQLIHFIATSPDALRTADSDAAGHARNGSRPIRRLSADDTNECCKWKFAAESFREQSRSFFPAVSPPVADSLRIIVIVLDSSTINLARCSF